MINDTAASPPSGTARIGNARGLAIFVFALFFIFGGITSLNDVLIPKLKGLFSLSYAEVMLVQSAFFIGYLLISLPAGLLVARIGYMRAATVGLLTMAVGCLLFLPAAGNASFAAFLGALFVIAGGITLVQVVANPLISLLGPPVTASSRLTFAQAFNSLGTTIFPYVGATLILGAVSQVDPTRFAPAALARFQSAEAAVISRTYVGLALTLVAVAGVVWLRRDDVRGDRLPAASVLGALDLLRDPRFAFGMACIFLYVGAEVSIGSLLTNYLMRPDTMALTAESAGKHLAFYWGGAMIGRFAGTIVLRMFRPGRVLAAAAVVVLGLLLCSGCAIGPLAGWTLLAVGLFNSIMFPTIFTLASQGLGHRASEGSGLICCAIVGGAVLPPLTGYVADAATLSWALIVPATAYVGIAMFGWYASASRPGHAA